jgi:hypothetical protein
MIRKSLLSVAIIVAVVSIAVWLLASNLWILLVPSIEAQTATGVTVNGIRHDVSMDVLRIGDDYLVPLIALGTLFDLEVRREEDGRKLLVRGGPNMEVEMWLYDPVATVNGKTRLLKVPPIDARSPMVPLRFFSKLTRRDVILDVPPSEGWSRLRRMITSLLMRKLVILNVIMGALFTGLWVSMSHIMAEAHKGPIENPFWRSLPYVLMALITLFYVLHVFITKIEGLFGPS